MQTKYKILIVIPLIIIIVAAGALLWRSLRTPSDDELETQGRIGEMTCPQDMRMCDDDTTVTRVAPSCNFALCPDGSIATATAPVSQSGTVPPASNNASGTEAGVACTMEAKMCPDGSFVGRTGPHCEFSPCP